MFLLECLNVDDRNTYVLRNPNGKVLCASSDVKVIIEFIESNVSK